MTEKSKEFYTRLNQSLFSSPKEESFPAIRLQEMVGLSKPINTYFKTEDQKSNLEIPILKSPDIKIEKSGFENNWFDDEDDDDL